MLHFFAGHEFSVRGRTSRGGCSREVEPPQTYRPQSPLHGRLQATVVRRS